MGLRRSTLLLTGLTLVVLLVALYSASRWIILDRFVALETDIVRQNVERGINALHARLTQIDLLATDWGNWDDAYAFVEEPTQEFITSNLTEETFSNQELDTILFFNTQGELVWGRFREAGLRHPEELPRPLREWFENVVREMGAGGERIHGAGVLWSPSGPLLVAVQPVLKSDTTGSPRGVLIMGCHFGPDEIASLSHTTRLDLSFRPFEDSGLPSDVIATLLANGGPAPVTLPSANEEVVTGYALVRDLFGQPSLIMAMSMSRDITRQGRDMLWYVLAAIALAGLVFSLVLLVFLEWRVISRISRLESQSGIIGTRRAEGRRVTLTGNDELARLSDSINDMLDRLEKTQEALEISEGKYRSLFLNTATAMLLVNAKTARIELVNAEFERLSGLSRETVEHKKSWKDFTLDFDALAIEDYLRRRSGSSKASLPGAIDCRFVGRDGDIRYVSLTVAMIAGTDTYIVSMIDLTDRKRAEEALAEFNRTLERVVAERTAALEDKARELKQANNRLLELDRLKSAFLSSVSHELRTPLTSIRGFAKLIRRDLTRLPHQSPDTGKWVRIDENLDIIMKESDRLTTLLNDFLDLSKIESGRMEWRDARLPVSDLIARGVEAVRGLFEEKKSICLSLDVPDGLPDIYADPDRMLQVLINLLSNAAKFTEQGVVRVAAARDGDDLRITVSDEGVGVPENDLEAIFGTFRQAAHGDILENKPKGTGLGLAICRTIVQHYGGRIWAESEVGRGSSFHVLLPAQLLVGRVGDASADPGGAPA